MCKPKLVCTYTTLSYCDPKLCRGLEKMAWGNAASLNGRSRSGCCYLLRNWAFGFKNTHMAHANGLSSSYASLLFMLPFFLCLRIPWCVMQRTRTFPFGSLSLGDFIAPLAVKSDIYLGADCVSKLGFNTAINNLVTPRQLNSTQGWWQRQVGLWAKRKTRLRAHGCRQWNVKIGDQEPEGFAVCHVNLEFHEQIS